MITDLLERPDLLHGVAAELVEHPGLDHLGRILLAVEHVEHAVAHVALGALGHALGLGAHGLHRLLADHHVVALEQHHAGREPVALGIDQRDRLAALVQPGHDRECGAQVDADGRDVGFGSWQCWLRLCVMLVLLVAAPKTEGNRSGWTCEIIR